MEGFVITAVLTVVSAALLAARSQRKQKQFNAEFSRGLFTDKTSKDHE